MKLTLKIWRQKNTQATGAFETYSLENISEGSSFLEMLDILSEDLVRQGKEPLAFDYDCREGICGMCSLTINGIPTDQKGRPPASCICSILKMVKPSR